ncbi:GntR family transcriptional regulator [Desulforhopalus vacuolatus]|uniref:GntR family transcriptional regulator n=1 Tax=Desulforhopalus vacuolatus TaxID=40414 RepID=UPI001965D1A5|nr:GntR family transcriptional regulator [Desulforhopalus vacuolatus]MBM9518279.1 GntR family transcriptional regulator [Desulforhopalus vacuolatus]
MTKNVEKHDKEQQKEKENRSSEEFAYQKLKTAIRKRYITRGSKLVETTLAEELGISRTPVRSAIKRLESEGLVNIFPNRGAFVITPTRREIEETFQVRAALESMAIELAIEKASDEQIAELRHIINREYEILERKAMNEYWPNNNAIHLKIAEMSDNRVLFLRVSEILEQSSLYLVLYDPFSRLDYCPMAEHEKLFAALKAKNKAAARAAMEEHLKSSTAYVYVAEEVPEDYISLHSKMENP